jgi:hypothetical protein
MPSVQNLNTDLVISNKVNPGADITLATRTVFIDGNLTVGGNTTTDSTHPGLVTFESDEQAKLFITLTDRKEDWKTTKNKII